MSQRTWIKIYCDKWINGTLREEPLALRGLWVDLLTLAGNGTYGDAGKIGLPQNVPLTDNQVAAILKIEPQEWLDGKSRLIETDRVRETAEGLIEIINWKKYQSEYSRQKSYRQKLQHKVTAKSAQEKEKEIEIEIENSTKDNISTNTNNNSSYSTSAPDRKKIGPLPKENVQFDFDKEEFIGISEKDMTKWAEAYPACDIGLEIKRAAQWLISNPAKRKKNYRRYITNWLSRTQERGGTRRGGAAVNQDFQGIGKKW